MIGLRLEQYFEDYESYHRNTLNLTIHKIAIPLIVFHVIAMLCWIPILTNPHVTLGEILILFAAVFYIRLDRFLGILMTIFMLLCAVIAYYIPVGFILLIAIAAWTAQLIGHYKYEKNSPAFSKSLVQILIGPFYILAKLTSRY